MKRQELEHIVRAAAGITGEKEFIVLGSQSILGKFPDAPHSLRHSMEVDIYLGSTPNWPNSSMDAWGSFQHSTRHSTITPME
jgi:hypothetical protein